MATQHPRVHAQLLGNPRDHCLGDEVEALDVVKAAGRTGGGGGEHGAHQLMVGICAARLRAHCGEELGCLLVPQLARRKNGHKHGMEGLYER